MTFFAVLMALLLAQLHPVPHAQALRQALAAWGQWGRRNLDAGGAHHAWLVWAFTVVLPALLVALVHALLAQLSLFLALAFSILVLYLMLGFREFSDDFAQLRNALQRGDDHEARQLLARWRASDHTDMPRGDLLRRVIEQALLVAHHRVFGVFFCFVVFSTLGLGPAGAVLYRLARYARGLAEREGAAVVPQGTQAEAAGEAVRPWEPASAAPPVQAPVRALAARLFDLIDHAPARITAFGFAVVGNFEDAVDAWRQELSLGTPANEQLILSTASGALGLTLGRPAPAGGADVAPAAAPPQLGHLRSVIGLIWRSMALWMLLLALLTLANLVG